MKEEFVAAPLGNCCSGALRQEALVQIEKAKVSPELVRTLVQGFIGIGDDQIERLGNCCSGALH